MAASRAKGAFGWLGVASLLVAACTSSAADDEIAPACGGVSPANLESEEAPDGGCPASPMTLIGMGGVGDACSDPTDCAPAKCTCPGTTGCAWVAECSNGNCLDGNTACCLYGLQCAQ
ncbi:MAG TPA: hypothetical protein VGL81_22810 [Polyangiaceae bacterium]|jgi:hypothetical protein